MDNWVEEGPDAAAGLDLSEEPPEPRPFPDMRPLLALVGAFGLAYYFALIRLVRGGDVFNSYPYISFDGFDWLVEGLAVARWFDGVAIPTLPAARSPGFVSVTFADFQLGADGHLLFAVIAAAVATSLAALVVLARWNRVPRYQAGVLVLVFALSPLGYYRMWVLSDQVAAALLVVAAVSLYPYVTRASRGWLGLATLAAALGGATQLYGLIGFGIAGGWVVAVSLWRRKPDYLLAGALVAAPVITLTLSAAWLGRVPHAQVPDHLSVFGFSFDMLGFYANAWSFAFLPLLPLLGVLFVYRRHEVLASPLLTGYWLTVVVLMLATFFYQFEDFRFTIPTSFMLGVAIIATLPGERPLPRPRQLTAATAALAILLGLVLAPASYWKPRWSDVTLDPSGTYYSRLLLRVQPYDRFKVASLCDSGRVCRDGSIPPSVEGALRARFVLYRDLVNADPVTATGDLFEGAGLFELRDTNDCCAAEISMTLGQAGDRPMAGDWDGGTAVPGADTPGLFRSGVWILGDSAVAAQGYPEFRFGEAGDVPVVGDWDGDGLDTIGVFRDGVWRLRNSNVAGPADVEFQFGEAADVPVSGDWDGDGVDTVGVYRNGRWLLNNANSGGPFDVSLVFGTAFDKPVVGDWNGDGADTIGVFELGLWTLRNSNTPGGPDLQFYYGAPGHIPVTGDWDGDGVDTIGVAGNASRSVRSHFVAPC